MSTLSLSMAIVNYGHTRALLDGTVRSERVELHNHEISPIPRAFRQMVRELEFDVSEMAFSTYLCARAHQKRMTGLPLFISRRFEHGQIVYHTRSRIQAPTDLHGRKVGVRSYTLTPSVWTRGILQSADGVDPSQVTWVLSGDEHVEEYVAPSNVVSAPAGSDLVKMLENGEIDAAIGVGNVESPDIKPLIPDAYHAGTEYFKQTGIYPISHLVVVKDALLDAHPWLAEELCTMFKAAKTQYLTQLKAVGAQSPQDEAMLKMQEVMGDDPISYGVEPNRTTMEAFIQFNVEQHIIPTSIKVDDLFPPSVLGLS